MSIFKELSKLMSKFFDEIETAIKNIHANHGVDNETVTKEIADAVSAGVAPLQTQLSDQQTQIAELQKALQDTVTALTSGDTDTALATASAAANGSASTGDSSSAGEGAASDDAAAGQAVS